MDELSDLFDQCRAVFLKCEEFQSNESLKAVFATSQLRDYAGKIPTERLLDARIDACLILLDSRRFNGEPLLALFLEILSKRYPLKDSMHMDLEELAEKARALLSKPQKTSFPISQDIDIGIVIALPEEFRELSKEFVTAYTSDYDKDLHAYYYYFQSAVSHANPYRCVATLIGNMGPTEAALATEKLINKCNPTTLVVLGIACSLDDEVLLGDVVVADVVDAYLDNSKAISETDAERFTFQFSGEPNRTSDDLQVIAKNFETAHREMYLKWQQRCADDLGKLAPSENFVEKLIMDGQLRYQPVVHVGHIASGPTVAASPAFKKWLKNKRDRKLLALEMESGGFMTAAHKRGPRQLLVLRAISDYGDENKMMLDKASKGVFRRYAVHNAMRWLWNFFEADIFRLTR